VPGGGHTNIYDQAVYAPQLAAFWVQTTTLLEKLTCATVDSDEPVQASVEPWQVWPNPVTGDVFQVQLPESVGSADLFVYDGVGRLALFLSNVQTGESVNMAGFSSGVYAVQIVDNQQTKKVFEVRQVVRQ